MNDPFFSNLNLRSSTGSTQLAHVPQVTGQAAATPGRAQRILVDLLAAHSQDLVILSPSLVILSLKAESTQAVIGVAVGAGVVATGAGVTGIKVGVLEAVAVGAGVGAFVGALDGDVVGPTGAADGLGDGLMDLVGRFVGSSLGALLGSKLGSANGIVLG
mmetsp:Transcript_12522/g.18962  ORF Transcript_12522/g.18962 Transcript_12522/m.18962 type:complete len:160 (+) Transcript_12522:283-762(+)